MVNRLAFWLSSLKFTDVNSSTDDDDDDDDDQKYSNYLEIFTVDQMSSLVTHCVTLCNSCTVILVHKPPSCLVYS